MYFQSQMRPRYSVKILLLALLLGLMAVTSSAVMAKSRWYQVEVIVFNHNDTAATSEQWPDLESLPDFRDAINLIIDRPPDPPGSVAIPGPLAFQSLRASDLKLSGIYRRLRNLSAYTPILHIGWRQPGLGGNRARSVYISDKPRLITDTSPTMLDTTSHAAVEGALQIRIGRLLHIVADFVKYGSESPVRITEQRQVKLKEIHYFDHPLFGVIVQVTPYRIADPAAPSDGEPADETSNINEALSGLSTVSR